MAFYPRYLFDYHAVWSTKRRICCLKGAVRQKIFDHIKENAKKNGILVHALNGGLDHLHLVFRLPKHLNVPKVMQLIKGESSHWINQQRLFPFHFKWGKGYFAEYLKPDKIPYVIRYVENQEKHHQIYNLEEELTAFRSVGILDDGIVNAQKVQGLQTLYSEGRPFLTPPDFDMGAFTVPRGDGSDEVFFSSA